MKNNILAIGVDKYYTCSKLENCVKDITNTLDVLTSKYEFDKNDIVTLFDNDATFENIIYQFEEFHARQNNQDNLIVLFSGHGDFDDKLDMGYLLPIESKPYNKATYIPNSTILQYVQAFEYKHVILISDSCFSGSLFSSYKSIPSPKERLLNIPSKWALTSGRIEKVLDGIPGSNSPFTESVLKHLTENTEILFGMSDLTSKVIADVASEVKQIPRGAPLQSLGDKGGEFMFQLKDKPKSTIISISPKSDEIKLLEGSFKEYYDIYIKIEDAENENKIATAKRLSEELNYVINTIKREITRLLATGRNIQIESKELDTFFGIDSAELTEKLSPLIEEKNRLARSQKFEEAISVRDAEKALMKEVFDKIVKQEQKIKDALKLNENSIEKDYATLTFLHDMSPISNRSLLKEYIERNFINTLFLKLSKDFELISKYKFEDLFLLFKTEVVPTCLKRIINPDFDDERADNILKNGTLIDVLRTKSFKEPSSSSVFSALRKRR